MTDIDLDAIEARRSAALAADHGQFYDAAVILADDVPALVAEVRRLREHATHDAEVEQALTADLDDARAAIARVRALHAPRNHAVSGGSGATPTRYVRVCDYCARTAAGDPSISAAYPCATIRALDGEVQ